MAGLKFDNNKPSLSLIPNKPLLEIAKVLDFGSKKYSAHNWREGLSKTGFSQQLLGISMLITKERLSMQRVA